MEVKILGPPERRIQEPYSVDAPGTIGSTVGTWGDTLRKVLNMRGLLG